MKPALPDPARPPRPEPKPATAYETRDASPRTVALTGGVIAAGVAGCLAVSAWYVHRHSIPEGADARQSSFTHSVSQQRSIVLDQQALARDAEEHLQTYAWVDQAKGTVRIPISRAMDALVAEAAASKDGNQEAPGK